MICIENEFISIGCCEKTGMLASLFCKAAKEEFMGAPSIPFEIFSDFKEPYRFKRWDMTYPPTEFGENI